MTKIDDLLKSATLAQQKILKHIRGIVLEMVPDAEETISYGVPTLKYKGQFLLHFAAFKDHMSLFPGSVIVEQLSNQLTGFKISKGTVQFTEDNLIPDDVVRRIVDIRLKSIKG